MLPPTDNVTFLTQKKKNFTRGWEKFSKKGLGWGGVGGKGVFFFAARLPACFFRQAGGVTLKKINFFVLFYKRRLCRSIKDAEARFVVGDDDRRITVKAYGDDNIVDLVHLLFEVA